MKKALRILRGGLIFTGTIANVRKNGMFTIKLANANQKGGCL